MAMCFAKKSIVLAIYGLSSVGKSTLANQLGASLQADVRHCGEVLKKRAAELGIPLQPIRVDLHRGVDAETRRISQSPMGIRVIEGRYLNLVLAGIPRVRFVRLTCDETERELRFLRRQSDIIMALTLHQHDQENADLSQELYGDSPPNSEDWIILDTTHSSPEKLVALILDRLRQELCHD